MSKIILTAMYLTEGQSMQRSRAFMWLVVGLILALGTSHAQEKKADGKKETRTAATVTAGGVTYVVATSSIAADGKKWTLVLEATSKGEDRKIQIDSARVITADGKTLTVKLPMGRKAVSLPDDTKILIELNMGDLPQNVTLLKRIELFGDRRVGIPGFKPESAKAFSGKKAEENRPLVLKDVQFDRTSK
jgi:hypothetical protein